MLANHKKSQENSYLNCITSLLSRLAS